MNPFHDLTESHTTQSTPDSDSSDRQFRYAAFISYRHVEPDRSWAVWLHRALETYSVPAPLRAVGHPARLGTVFRDDDELSAAPNLRVEIEAALRDSRNLIVICSPNTPKSSWVAREVNFYRQIGRADRVLALLVGGEITDTFPHALPEPNSSNPDLALEPLAADVRPVRGESRRHQRRRALLRIASQLLGCSFDDLLRRDAERRRARLFNASALAGLVCVVTLGSLVFAHHENARAHEMQVLRTAEAAARVREDTLRVGFEALQREQRQNRARSAKDEVVAKLPNLYRRALWKEARTLIDTARKTVESDHDPVIAEELADWAERIELLRTLDEIRARKAALAAAQPDRVWHAVDIREAYRVAFEKAGYDFCWPGAPADVGHLARKLSSSPVRHELIAALDDWAWGVRDRYADTIWATTARVTGEEWRTRLQFTSLSAPEALRLTRDEPITVGGRQIITPAIVCGLGFTMRLFLYGDNQHPVRWMEAGAKAYSDDFWVLFYLGVEYAHLHNHEAAAGAFRAALAIRPEAELARKSLESSLEKARAQNPKR